jgi:transposase
VCIETRHAQRFLSSRPVKTDKNDARGIAEMMRLDHDRPVHVKSPAAQAMGTTLAARMQLVASQMQIEGTIRGLLKVYGLKIGLISSRRRPSLIVGSNRAIVASARSHARRTEGGGPYLGRLCPAL